MDQCTIRKSEIVGWSAVTLSNGIIEITVLPEKGADIYRFVDVCTGIDVLFKSPWGLQPPDSSPRQGSGDVRFLHNYEGGWQELFPNTFTPSRYDGKEIPLHGEVATLPWNLAVELDDPQELRIRLDVTCHQLPLQLTRRMRLSAKSRTLVIEETVRNLSTDRVPFVWGHHPVVGPPFLEAGCRVNVDKVSVYTPNSPVERSTASIASGQQSVWPYVEGIDGTMRDLREVRGPSANAHDHAYLTGFDRGWVEIENPRRGLAFALEWDASVFRWLVNWRPFGGSHQPPLEGVYAMGLEPWATRSNLSDALSAGDAIWITSKATVSAWLKATLRHTISEAG